MPNLTDEVTSKALADGSRAAEKSLKAAKTATAEAVKAGENAVKGICLLILDGGAFTAENVMKAVKNVAFKRTGDIKYSKNNIDISKLQKSGHVYKVEENITAEVMKHFDVQCKKYDVQYAAMKDDRNPDKPAYMVFFKGKDSDMLLHVIQESYKDYMNEKADQEEQKKSQTDISKGKKRNTPEKRESVKAKLAFFRDRVADRDREQDALEKHHSHSDIQR